VSERYLPIEDYAAIGDLRSAALVSREGGIDWLCWPRFDSPSLFARLLDADRGGTFRIAPDGDFTATRKYLDATNVLETTFTTASGSARLVDFMSIDSDAPTVIRKLEGIDGEVTLRVGFEPRPGYASEAPRLREEGDEIHVDSATLRLRLRGDVALTCKTHHATGTFTLRAGETRRLVLSNAEAPRLADAEAVDAELERTVAFWRKWASQLTYDGPYKAMVLRSALVLKLLTYRPTGALIAAPTTSLPEHIGGVRNWDYRFCWLRDASFTVSALDNCGFEDEGAAFVAWMIDAARVTEPNVDVLYDVNGGTKVDERVLDTLSGYRDSHPVRIGNAVHDQFQLDVYGEVVAAVEEHIERGGQFVPGVRIPDNVQHLLRRLLDVVVRQWREPDSGIWEKRSGRHQHVHAKVLAWSALDTARRLVANGCMDGDDALWKREMDAIHAAVLEQGFNAELNSLVSIFGGDELDASLLYAARVGFLDPRDPRLLGTIAAIRKTLGHDDLVYRYEVTTNDGLPPGEGAFLACSFWLAEALTLAGESDEAHRIFEKLCGRANDVGLLPEQIDVATGAFLGNFPQALTHVALMNAALSLAGEAARAVRKQEQRGARNRDRS
jgi:GH15 family glucan-1,4-alpha-glucosidase